MAGRFYFDPELHRYEIDGRRVPSVTEIIRPYLRGSDRFTDEGRERGSRVHKAVQFYLENDLGSIDSQDEGYLEALRKLDAAIGLRRPSSKIEGQVFDPMRLYAGTFDWLDPDAPPSELGMLDWKSTGGSVDPATSLQTIGYAVPSDFRGRRAGVALRPNGTFKIYHYDRPENRNDRGHFLNALALHQRFVIPTIPARETKEEISHVA